MCVNTSNSIPSGVNRQPEDTLNTQLVAKTWPILILKNTADCNRHKLYK